jgi:hypothetical protein
MMLALKISELDSPKMAKPKVWPRGSRGEGGFDTGGGGRRVVTAPKATLRIFFDSAKTSSPPAVMRECHNHLNVSSMTQREYPPLSCQLPSYSYSTLESWQNLSIENSRILNWTADPRDQSRLWALCFRRRTLRSASWWYHRSCPITG